ncbi:hypothetical protein GCM10012287_26320 [Streptomyces daqingensis]|uniref:Uncharacterized protein n=1 Tax=Streptomyces daqingensis TaxID=1472640 RepID=A0ABQ2MBU8_9ACTN|nr:hypothetical protein GCM10012287_26320 [Streptomyces daqingensis]
MALEPGDAADLSTASAVFRDLFHRAWAAPVEIGVDSSDGIAEAAEIPLQTLNKHSFERVGLTPKSAAA